MANSNDSFIKSEINLDELEKQNARDEAELQAEIDAIKQEYVEKFGGPPTPLADAPVKNST